MILALIVLGVAIGLTLGALGAGGSILAVPVLVHVAGLSATAATATSLVAVGSAAALAATGRRRNVRLDVALWFVPTGVVGALIGASVGSHLSDDALLMAFSALMLVAAHRMMATKPATPRSLSAAAHQPVADHPLRAGTSTARSASGSTRRRGITLLAIATAGGGVGFLTGLFGVGGGFVIVPALTVAVGLAMRPAIATSLVIVAANAVIALTVRGVDAVDWPIAVALTVPMLAGSIVGARFGRRINPDNARRTFAALLVAVALVNAVAVVA
ncbi:MAG TPA: sulfite exporter TauE/SafE family protein [Ilumatobacter sp.]